MGPRFAGFLYLTSRWLAMVIVVTSWDDGRATDMKMARLLEKHGLKGTFYVSSGETRELSKLTFGREGQYDAADLGRRLTAPEVRRLSQIHEVGCHGHSHTRLNDLDEEQMCNDILQSKRWLEQATGRNVVSFSYPFGSTGDWDARAVKVLKEHGFTTARTSGRFCIRKPQWPMSIVPTWEAFPRTAPAGPNFLRELLQNLGADRALVGAVLAGKSWTNQAKVLFKAAQRRNGVFHLWGHSWMVDKLGMWEELDGLLKWIGEQESVKAMTVGELWTHQ